MFGIDMAPPTTQSTAVTATASSNSDVLSRSGKSMKPVVKSGGGRQRLTRKKRQGEAERMRTYWAGRRAQTLKRKAAKL